LIVLIDQMSSAEGVDLFRRTMKWRTGIPAVKTDKITSRAALDPPALGQNQGVHQSGSPSTT
jgi:hypothetical protein